MAISTCLFLLPNKISTGGLSGIATITYHFLNWKVGTVILIMNIPIFIVAYIKKGWKYPLKSLLGVALFSLFLNMYEDFYVVTDSFLFASIFGGVIMGIGLGFVFKAHGSTGGTDLIVQLLRDLNKKMKLSHMLLMIDGVVVLVSTIVFRNWKLGIYSIIAILVSGRIIDVIHKWQDI